MASSLGNHMLNRSIRKHLMPVIFGELAEAQEKLRLDTNTTLLGGECGVLDLQTKTVRPYLPQDLISKSVGFEIATWDAIPPATKSELETVLAQLWPDEDQRDFMIRLNAQTLDGSVRKYVLCSIGPSNSGKSLDGELLRAALGREAGYADTVPSKSLSTAPPAQDKPNTEVIGLEGKRLASQLDADLAKARLSVTKLQSWSGGDPIPVREQRAQTNREPPVTPNAFVTRLPNPAKAASAATAASPVAAAAPLSSHKRARVPVPDDLDGLSHGALVGLVNELVHERAALEREAKTARTVPTPQTKPASKPATKASKPAAKPAPSAAGATEPRIDALRARLATKAIKKTKHNDKRKPYTTVTEGVASKDVALRLMRGQEAHLKSDTSRMTRWLLGPAEATEAISADLKLIHPVAYDGYTWCLPGDDGYVYAAASIDSLEVKYERASSLLTFKFRTRYAGSGRPPHMVLVEDEDDSDDLC